MPLKGLRGLFVVWGLMLFCPPVFAVAPSPYTHQLLQTVVRMEAVAQPPSIAAHLQLLHALVELDLGMTDAAERRLATVRGGLSAREMAQQLQLFRALRLWQRGDFDNARGVLSSLTGKLPDDLHRERQLLQALLLFAAGEHGRAIVIVSELRPATTFLSPVTLDLALMLARSGELEFAITLLQLLGNSEAGNGFEAQLRDRANLALARLFSRQGKNDAALGVLERVRLNGPDGSVALLLLGWLRLEVSGSEAALVPWLELSLRSDNEPAVLEGKLAVAMALAQRSPDSAAYEEYSAVAEFYRQRLSLLDATLTAIEGAEGDTVALQKGQGWAHAGSVRATHLAAELEELQQLQGEWSALTGEDAVDVEQLRQALLDALRRTDAELALQPESAVWRTSYANLYRLLQEEFERERVRSGTVLLSNAPIASEMVLFNDATAVMRSAYRQILKEELLRQRQRLALYLQQSLYATARLQETAFVQHLEVR